MKEALTGWWLRTLPEQLKFELSPEGYTGVLQIKERAGSEWVERHSSPREEHLQRHRGWTEHGWIWKLQVFGVSRMWGCMLGWRTRKPDRKIGVGVKSRQRSVKQRGAPNGF